MFFAAEGLTFLKVAGASAKPFSESFVFLAFPSFSSSDFWRANGMRLTYKDASSERFIRDQLSSSSVVMVSFRAGSRLSRELATDPLTLAYSSNPETGVGEWLYWIP